MTLMEKAYATVLVATVQELSQEDLELISGGGFFTLFNAIQKARVIAFFGRRRIW